MISPLIEAEELLLIKDSVKIFDIGNGTLAIENYQKNHLENAVFIDVNIHLSEIKENKAYGGRHPLPTIENFKTTLQNLGINPQDHLVLYDMNCGANAAARFWWMLRAIGHQKVQILNGGMAAAGKIGFPFSNQLPEIQSTNTENLSYAENWQFPLVTMNEVVEYSKNQEKLIIDVREFGRYNGEYEPIDLVAGHIPNAINIPFQKNLDSQGKFLNLEILRDLYLNILGSNETDNCIIHCGSGVTACHTILAMEYAGFKTPALYVGSWSEWSRNF